MRASDNHTGAGCVIWLTGLSGAGKSTLSRRVSAELAARGHRVEVLDGDVVRESLSCDLGFSREDRDANVRRVAFVADLLSRNGVVVIVALVSPYRAARDDARARIGACFVEAYVKASVDACAQRDTKGLYARARAGEIENLTGYSDPYEEPLAPDVLLDTEQQSPDDSTTKLVDYVEMRVGIPARA